MAEINGVDVQEFSVKVERLCEFLLDKIEHKDGSEDVRVIQDLKEQAADLHMGGKFLELYGDQLFEGLNSHMRGVPHASSSNRDR